MIYSLLPAQKKIFLKDFLEILLENLVDLLVITRIITFTSQKTYNVVTPFNEIWTKNSCLINLSCNFMTQDIVRLT